MTLIYTPTGRIHLRDYDDTGPHRNKEPRRDPEIRNPRPLTAEYERVLNVILERNSTVVEIAAELRIEKKRATAITRTLEAQRRIERAGLAPAIGGYGRQPIIWRAK